MKIERFEQAHELAEGQLVTDAEGNLWRVHKYLHRDGPDKGRTRLRVKLSGETYALGDDALLPWSTVKVVPDDGLPRPVLEPCPVCGKADWPEGGMHAARSIHMRGHERVTSSTMCGGCGDMQQLTSDASFVPHTSRRTGEPCPGEPGIPTADAAAGWRQFCAGLDQPELWR